MRFVLFISLLGLSALLLTACPAGTCSPANCRGCCDTAGECITTTTAAACGSIGEDCKACTAPTNTCVVGACATTTGGGSGGGSMGGGSGGGSMGGGSSGGGTGGGSDGGTTGGGTGGGTTDGGAGGGCAALDFSQGQTIAGEYIAETMIDPPVHFGVVAAQNTLFDFISFGARYYGNNSSPTFPKTVSLASPTGAPLGLCYDCLSLAQACDDQGMRCAGSYYATSGSMMIASATRNVSAGTFVATGTNLTFVEWDFQGDAPIANGRCVTVATVTLNSMWDAGLPDAGTDAGTDAGN